MKDGQNAVGPSPLSDPGPLTAQAPEQLAPATPPPGDQFEASTTADVAAGSGASRQYAFSGGLWSAAATVLPMGTTLALSVVIKRALGADLLGAQSLVAYVASLMTTVVIYSFTAASVQLLASAIGSGDEVRVAFLSRWSMRAHVTGGAVAALVMSAIGAFRPELQLIWVIAGLTAFVDSLGWAYACRSIARTGWSATGARRLLAQGVAPSLGILAVALGAGIRGVFGSQLLVSVVLVVFLRRLERRDPTPATAGLTAPDWAPVVRIWSMFALSTLITQIVERRVELVFLDHYYRGSVVAEYSVAFNVVGIAIMICASLISAAIPAIAAAHAAGGEQRVVESLGRALRVVVSLSLLFTASAVGVGPSVVTAFWGSDFTEAASLVRWLSLTLLVAPVGALCTAYWAGTGRLRPVLVAGGVGAVLDLGLAATLIPTHGASGAVVASIVGQGSAAALIVAHTLRSGLALRIDPGRVLRVALTASAAGAAAWAAGAATGGWTALGGSLLALVVVTAAGSRLLGLFAPADVRWFADTLPGPAGRILLAVSPPVPAPAGAG